MTDATWPDYTPQPITLALIRALDKSAPPDKPREIRDKAAGLILRHQKSGYLGLYVSLGRGKRERLCNARRIIDPQSTWTLARARSDGRRINVEHENGRDFSAERKARAAVPTLEAFIDNTYKGWLLQNRRNGEASVQRIKTVYPDLLSVRLDVITPVGLEPWRLARKQKGVQSPETASLEHEIVRAVRRVPGGTGWVAAQEALSKIPIEPADFSVEHATTVFKAGLGPPVHHPDALDDDRDQK